MPHLDLAGVSADGRRLHLVDEHGKAFTLDVTPALRAALRGETTRTAKLETQMTSTLRPREIQARIRAGETAEAVAEAARTTVEAIMPYAAPVLAEREHIAERAQRASIRRPAGDGAGSSGARVLADAVTAHLRANATKPDTVTWDAFRRDDGRWELTAAFESTHRSGTARFAYDVPGSYVLAENEDARWLVGDLVVPTSAPARDDLEQARQRRLAAVSSDELPLGDDALDLVSGEAAEALVDAAPTYDEPVRDTSAELDLDLESGAPPAAPDPTPHRRAVSKKRGRASVPSWDEIMFGGGADRS
jgi:hypothetical protein